MVDWVAAGNFLSAAAASGFSAAVGVFRRAANEFRRQESIVARKPKNEISQKAFVIEVLTKNNNATVRDVKDAWEKSGYKGDLNQSIFYTARKGMGISSGKARRGRKPGRKPKDHAAPAAAPVHHAVKATAPRGRASYLQIEKSLDHLIVVADGLENHDLAEALRHARRRVSSPL